MRRRMIILLAALALVSVSLAAQPPDETYALQAYLEKAKSDCLSLQAAITLTYNHDDTGDEENRDYFRLEVYDMADHLLAHVEESITQEQSPFYWQTGRLPAAPWNGKYLIVVLDTNDKDKEIRRIERVLYDCTTDYSWREDKPVPREKNKELPDPDCYAWAPIFTTNLAPEDGAVLIMWSYDPVRIDNPEFVEYHLVTIDVMPNTGLDHALLYAPCGTYLRAYFQPDSTKMLYYMPSQYWPHDIYGVPKEHNELGPVYYTFFPLDGPPRDEFPTLTPAPTLTPLPTLTPTPK